MNRSAKLALRVAALTFAGAPTAAEALPIPETSAAFTYRYDSGTGVADPNAVNGNTSFNKETAAAGNASYYYTSSAPATGTVSYTFITPLGYQFSGNATSRQNALVAFDTGGSVSENVYPNSTGAGTPVFSKTLVTNTDGQFDYNNELQRFSVNGDTAFTIVYTLDNTSTNPIFAQVFRETNGATDTPFLVNGVVTAVPEPASFAVMSAAGVLLLRRRRA